jgi:hypothetical protein
MKQVLAIFGSLIGLILLAMLSVPYFFKDNILDALKQQANQQLEAEVAFSNDIGLSLFTHFPDATLTVNDIRVVNKAPFKGDTLAQVPQFSTTIDLFSLLGRGPMTIEAVHLEQPHLHVQVLENGKANYDIVAGDTTQGAAEAEAAPDTGSSTFRLALNTYSISQGEVTYDDQSTGVYTQVADFTHEGSGDFTLSQFDLDTETAVQALTLRYGGVNYLDSVTTKLDAVLAMNLDSMRFTFRENTLKLNDFTVGFDGYVGLPADAIAMDLSVETKDTRFKQLLSLVPAIYEQDFEQLETRGELTFTGTAAGRYTTDQYPAFQANLTVKEGYFHYPDLPQALEAVNLNLSVENPGGALDNTVTRLAPLRFTVDEEPFKARMLLETPMSDPFVDGAMQGTLNLGNLKKLVPLGEETLLAGILDTDIALKGHYSAIEEERYADFKASGNLALTDFRYQSPDLEPLLIPEARLSLSPQQADLRTFQFESGQSDLQANGQLTNLLGYALKGNTLKGNFTVQSGYFNLNPFLTSEEEGAQSPDQADQPQPDTGGGYALEAPRIPANLDLTLKADQLDQLVYATMDMRNIRGEIQVRDQAIYLKDFRMAMLDGTMTASGSYSTQDPEQPRTAMDLSIQDFSMQAANRTFTTLQQYAPVAKHTYGDFDADLAFDAPVQDNLMPVYDSIFSKGNLQIDKAIVRDYKVLNAVADKLQDDRYRQLEVTNINPKYIIEEGQIRLREPVRFQSGDNQFRLDGSMSLKQELNYVLRANVPGGELQQRASQLVSEFTGQDTDLGNRVLVDFMITGKPGNPQIKPKFAGTAGGDGGGGQQPLKQAKDKLKEKKQKAEEKLEQEKKKAKRKAKEKAKKQKEKAKEKAEKKKEEAKEKAEEKIKDIFK